MIDPRRFLDSVAGYTGAATVTRVCRMATVDDAYAGVDRPRVTFDGDVGLSTTGFEWLRPYVPTAGDRVVMLPVGTTYVIAGSVGG